MKYIGSLNLGQKTGSSYCRQQNENIISFTVPANFKVQKEIEKTHMSCQKTEETVKHKGESCDSHYRSTEKGK